MSRTIQKGAANQSLELYIIDSTNGTPETGVLWNTAGMDLKYRREGAAVVSVTEATLAALTTAHADGGFLEIGNGWYRFDLPDAAFATGADSVLIFGTVTGMIVMGVGVQLVDYDPMDSVRLGLTALPNANADAAGGLPISDAGGLDLDTKLADANEITAARMAALTDWIDGGRLDLLLDAVPGAVHDEALSGHQTQGTAGAALTMAAYLGPRGPGVYINDAAANTGTIDGEDGTLEKPVSTIAAATTIATSLGVKRFYLINDTLITLAQAYEDYEFVGIGLGNQVTLGSQDVDNTKFYDLTVTGTQGGTGMMYTEKCTLNALLSAEIIALGCWLLGDNALRAATNHTFDFCSSAVPGSGTPELTFPAGVTNVNFRHYSGGIQLNNGISTSTISIECDGQIIVDATCVSMNVVYRGNCSLTDNGTTTNLTQDAAITRAAINAEVDIALATTTYPEPTSVPPATSSIQDKIAWQCALSRNKGTQTSTTKTLRNDADTADIATSAVSDDSTTFIRNEWL